MASTKRTERAQELKGFLDQLVEYRHFVLLFRANKTTRLQAENGSQLRASLMEDVGRLRPLITELSGKDTVPIVKNGKEYMRDVWLSGLSLSVDSMTARVLESCIDVTRMAIGRLKSDIEGGVRDKQGNPIEKQFDMEPPKAFIAHEGMTKPLERVKAFLDALGIKYLIAEIEPSDGRVVEGQVEWTQGQADFAVILATKGKAVNRETGRSYMGLNVADELGRAREVFKNRIILLLQEGVEPHTNISGIVYEPFSPRNMEGTFIKIVKELRNWGFLEVGKVETEK